MENDRDKLKKEHKGLLFIGNVISHLVLRLSTPSNGEPVVESFTNCISQVLLLLYVANEKGTFQTGPSLLSNIATALAELDPLSNKEEVVASKLQECSEEDRPKLEEAHRQLQALITQQMIMISANLLAAVLPVVLPFIAPMMDSSRCVGVMMEPFQLLIHALMTATPVASQNSDRVCQASFLASCDFDRYALSFLALMPRFYVIAIRQACFALLAVMHQRGISPDQVKDYNAIVGRECELSKYIQQTESSLPGYPIHLAVGNEEAVVKKLLECGVRSDRWGKQ